MTRPILAVLISTLLLVGAYSYIQFSNGLYVPAVQIDEDLSTGEYSAVVSRTFDCIGNADFEIESILVRFRGKTVYQRDDSVPSGERIEIRPLEDVLVEGNTMFVSASPSVENDLFAGFDAQQEKEPEITRAVRVQVYRDNLLITDQTLWQQPGAQSVTGTIMFNAPSKAADNHGH